MWHYRSLRDGTVAAPAEALSQPPCDGTIAEPAEMPVKNHVVIVEPKVTLPKCRNLF